MLSSQVLESKLIRVSRRLSDQKQTVYSGVTVAMLIGNIHIYSLCLFCFQTLLVQMHVFHGRKASVCWFVFGNRGGNRIPHECRHTHRDSVSVFWRFSEGMSVFILVLENQLSPTESGPPLGLRNGQMGHYML